MSDTQAPAKRKLSKAEARLHPNTRGIILSFAAVIGLIGFIYVFTYTPVDETKAVKVVDYQPMAATARASGAFDVATPTLVDSGYVATSVRYLPTSVNAKTATWHLGFINQAANTYFGIEQSNTGDSDFIKESTVNGKRNGEEVIKGQAWERYDSPEDGYKSLVLRGEGTGQAAVTTVVSGTLSYNELAVIAGNLATS